MNTERMRLIADILDLVPHSDSGMEPGFNMNDWIDSDHEQHSTFKPNDNAAACAAQFMQCGTRACIAGYASLLSGEPAMYGDEIAAAAQRWLDLTDRQRQWLFYGYWTTNERPDDEEFHPLADAPNAHAAAILRAMADAWDTRHDYQFFPVVKLDADGSSFTIQRHDNPHYEMAF